MDIRPLTVVSLCAGVGGLDIGFKLAEPTARVVCHVEIEAYACEVLATRMEEQILDEAPIWTDLRTFNGCPWRGVVDCITAGYPCQPFSVAGKKLGDKDPRHLWPEIKRIIQEIGPQFCFFENVGGHLRLGFQQVHDDLQTMGYCIKAGLFTAEEVGATHKRERLFILAYRDSDRCQRTTSASTRENDPQGWSECATYTNSGRNDPAAEGFSVHQAGYGETENRQGLSITPKILADTTRPREQRKPRNIPATQRRSDNGMLWITEPAGQDLADGNSTGSQKTRQEFAPAGFEQGVPPVDHTNLQGLEGRSFCTLQLPYEFPAWPPSPSDDEAWESIPDHLKPAVHRMADGMADRVDRIRTCGNGVVPLVAAYAWLTLKPANYIN